MSWHCGAEKAARRRKRLHHPRRGRRTTHHSPSGGTSCCWYSRSRWRNRCSRAAILGFSARNRKPRSSLPAVLYVMYNSVQFEWDAEKNRSNQKKHAGIDFEIASRVFADPNLMLRKDRVINGEQRWHAIGAVRRAVLLVVHVYREENSNGEEVIRIISAREADPRERRIYMEQAPH